MFFGTSTMELDVKAYPKAKCTHCRLQFRVEDKNFEYDNDTEWFTLFIEPEGNWISGEPKVMVSLLGKNSFVEKWDKVLQDDELPIETFMSGIVEDTCHDPVREVSYLDTFKDSLIDLLRNCIKDEEKKAIRKCFEILRTYYEMADVDKVKGLSNYVYGYSLKYLDKTYNSLKDL